MTICEDVDVEGLLQYFNHTVGVEVLRESPFDKVTGLALYIEPDDNPEGQQIGAMEAFSKYFADIGMRLFTEDMNVTGDDILVIQGPTGENYLILRNEGYKMIITAREEYGAAIMRSGLDCLANHVDFTYKTPDHQAVAREPVT